MNNTANLLIFFLCNLFSIGALSANYYVPFVESLPAHSLLIVNNPQQQSTSFDLIYLNPHNNKVASLRLEIGSERVSTISLSKLQLTNSSIWLKVKDEDFLSFKVKLSFQTVNEANPLSGFVSQLQIIKSHNNNKPDGTLIVSNYSNFKNKINIIAFNSSDAVLYKLNKQLKPYQKAQFKLNNTMENVSYFKIKSQRRARAFLLTDHSSKNLQAFDSQFLANKILTNSSEYKYFLVDHQKNRGNENFVIKLKNPALILEARNIIKNNSHKIIVGKLKAYSGNFNRNFAQSSSPLWSWQLELNSFSEQGLNDCDSNPQIIEDYLSVLLPAKNYICMWDFVIKKELTIDELNNGILKNW